MVVGNFCKLELGILFLLTCLSDGSDVVDVKIGFRCLPFAFIVLFAFFYHYLVFDCEFTNLYVVFFEWALVLGLREPKGPPCAIAIKQKNAVLFLKNNS